MSITTNLSPDFVVPGTSHSFSYLLQTGALVNVPLTVAIIATKRASGTGVVGRVYSVSNIATVDVLAGPNSEGSIMVRHAALCAQLFQQGPRVKLTLIDEPGGGTARVQTITWVGSPSVDGTVIIRISGRTFAVSLNAGDAQNNAAAAASNEFKKKAETLPVIVTVAANVVTLTHPTKGVNGNDVLVEIIQQVAGIVATVAQTVAGAGAADLQPALDALSTQRYEGICCANHTSADISEALLDIAVRWSAPSKNWGWYFFGERGSLGTATSLAAASNNTAILICNQFNNRNAPGELAVAAAMLAFSRERSNAGYDGAIVPLFTPEEVDLYTESEVNTAIKAGITVFTGIIDSSGSLTEDRSVCRQMVTSKTTINGNPDARNRDLAVSRTGVALAIQLDIATGIALGAETNPTGVNQSDSEPLIRSLASAILRAEAKANPPVLDPNFVEQDVSAIVIEQDEQTLGRNDVLLPYHVLTPLHQVAWSHNVIVGGGK